jgi:hypothetical protein
MRWLWLRTVTPAMTICQPVARRGPLLLSELPDGVFIVHDDEFWLANDGGLNRWTPTGYTDRIDQFHGPAAVLTTHATVEAIRAGYRPLVHLHALPRGSVVLSAAVRVPASPPR